MRRKGAIGRIGTVALIGLLLLPWPMTACATDSATADTIAALEARVAALEAQIEAIHAALEEPAEPEPETLSMGQTVTLADGQTLRFTEYATGTQFRYTPSGRFASQSLTTRPGYSLLCLFVSLHNTSDTDLDTSTLLASTLYYGASHENQAQNSFFYQTAFGTYSDGLVSVGPGASVDGCLLFAVPDEVETSRERIAIQFRFGETAYECVIRPSGALLESGEPTTF